MRSLTALTRFQEQIFRDALRYQDMVDEYSKAVDALGGPAMLEALHWQNSVQEGEDLRRTELKIAQEVRDLASGFPPHREAMEAALGKTTLHGLQGELLDLTGPHPLHGAAERLAWESTGVEALRLAAASREPTVLQLAREAECYRTFDVLAREGVALEGTFACSFKDLDRHFGMNETMKAALAIEKPWIDALQPNHSFVAFAKLSEIGSAIAGLRLNDIASNEHLRSLMGTWTPPDNFGLWDEAQRAAAFYASGVDRRIFDIPDWAFEDVARAAGIVQPAPEITPKKKKAKAKAAKDPTTQAKTGKVSVPFVGTTTLDAHAQVQSAELMIRDELAWRAPTKFGPKWKKTYIHGNVLAELRARQANSRVGKSDSLMDYLTFGELVQIVMRKEIWEGAFSDIGMTREEFTIATGRLMEIRNAVDHGRKLNPVEFIWCFSEATRLQVAFGIFPFSASIDE